MVRVAPQPGADLVVRLRAAQRSQREPVADLDALHRLDAHEREREPRIEPVLLRRVRAEPRRDSRRAHLDDAADRVALLARLVDSRAQALLVDGRPPHLDADLPQQGLRDGAGGDVHGGVPRRRALERVPHVVMAVLPDAGEVGVAGPRERHRLRALPLRLALGGPGAHPPRPALVVAVRDDDCERRAERAPVPEPGEHLDAVLLDLLPRGASVALLAALQVGVDRLAVELEACGQALEDRDERGAVGFARGREPEGHGRRA